MTTGSKRTKSWYKSKDTFLRKTYGISIEDWWEMLLNQDKRCAVCRRKFKIKGKASVNTPQVDHHHGTGRVRGLLCRVCNFRILPYFEDRPEIIQNLKDYLIE